MICLAVYECRILYLSKVSEVVWTMQAKLKDY
jgi:hypothetical protein